MAKFIGWLERRASGRTLEVLLLGTELLYQPTLHAKIREMLEHVKWFVHGTQTDAAPRHYAVVYTVDHPRMQSFHDDAYCRIGSGIPCMRIMAQHAPPVSHGNVLPMPKQGTVGTTYSIV
jgi:hypothetical protein